MKRFCIGDKAYHRDYGMVTVFYRQERPVVYLVECRDKQKRTARPSELRAYSPFFKGISPIFLPTT